MSESDLTIKLKTAVVLVKGFSRQLQHGTGCFPLTFTKEIDAIQLLAMVIQIWKKVLES